MTTQAGFRFLDIQMGSIFSGIPSLVFVIMLENHGYMKKQLRAEYVWLPKR